MDGPAPSARELVTGHFPRASQTEYSVRLPWPALFGLRRSGAVGLRRETSTPVAALALGGSRRGHRRVDRAIINS